MTKNTRQRTWGPRTMRPLLRRSRGRSRARNPFIVVLGPTGSGKSNLAIHLAKRFSGFIIGADSRQVYEGMEIGTAQPRGKWRTAVPHFFYGHVRANAPITLAQYQRAVFRVLKKQRGLPFLVGGTGLYIDAVTQNWDIPRVKPNSALRRKLEKLSLKQLARQLSSLDPESARSIDMKNRRRIIRALEVVLATKQSFLAQKKKRPFPYRVLKIGLNPSKNIFKKNIRQRVHDMFRRGLVVETEKLLKKYPAGLPALSGIGYREVQAFLDGKISQDDAIDHIVIRTRQYAKRQMTWFKRDPEIHWVSSKKQAEGLLKRFLQ